MPSSAAISALLLPVAGITSRSNSPGWVGHRFGLCSAAKSAIGVALRWYFEFRHARACRGHPRLNMATTRKSWMAGTSPAMTNDCVTGSTRRYRLTKPDRWLSRIRPRPDRPPCRSRILADGAGTQGRPRSAQPTALPHRRAVKRIDLVGVWRTYSLARPPCGSGYDGSRDITAHARSLRRRTIHGPCQWQDWLAQSA